MDQHPEIEAGLRLGAALEHGISKEAGQQAQAHAVHARCTLRVGIVHRSAHGEIGERGVLDPRRIRFGASPSDPTVAGSVDRAIAPRGKPSSELLCRRLARWCRANGDVRLSSIEVDDAVGGVETLASSVGCRPSGLRSIPPKRR